MGKHEPMTAKAIGIRIKAKGLQKIKYYCEMCRKQCRDDNGFKCHIMSESHQKQALIVSENPDLIVNDNSKQFTEAFMFILKTRYKTKKVLANTVFQEQIKDRDHVHLNGTRWTTLTDFAHWLGENGLVKVENSERGVMVTYIDRDPETLRRQELEAKRVQQAKEAAIKAQKEIERQRAAAKKLYEEIEKEKEKPAAEPVPIVKVPIQDSTDGSAASSSGQDSNTVEHPSTNCDKDSESTTESPAVERPLFGIQAITLKAGVSNTSYKPPKRKILKKFDAKKKIKKS
jgi:DNA/RNA-binding protein KIN17